MQIENSVTRVTVRHQSESLVMPNSYPRDRIFNPHLSHNHLRFLYAGIHAYICTRRYKHTAQSSGEVRCSIWAATWQNQQNGMCAQRRLRSAWLSAQSDKSLRCALKGKLRNQGSFMRMPRLIWVFAGRTDHIVGFVICALNIRTQPFTAKNGEAPWCLWCPATLKPWAFIHSQPV